MFQRIAISVLGLMFCLSVSAEVKFGYVDMQKAIQSTSAGKKAKKTLEKAFEKKKKELKKKEADLKKMTADLKKKRLALSEQAFAKKQRALQEEMYKYQQTLRTSQVDIQKKERQLTEPILKKLLKMVDKIAKDEKLSMVFEKNEQSVLWAAKKLDITDKAIKKFEKSK